MSYVENENKKNQQESSKRRPGQFLISVKLSIWAIKIQLCSKFNLYRKSEMSRPKHNT